MSTKDGRVCVAAIGLKDVAALQLAQPSLGKMAVKEPHSHSGVRTFSLLGEKREGVVFSLSSGVELYIG